MVYCYYSNCISCIINFRWYKKNIKCAERLYHQWLLYILGALLLVLGFNLKEIPSAIMLIINSAFNPKAALGGTAGITVAVAIQRGVGRGVFSNGRTSLVHQ